MGAHLLVVSRRPLAALHVLIGAVVVHEAASVGLVEVVVVVVVAAIIRVLEAC